ncbi:integrin alpha-8 isoform X2 [Scomber japonicus]|uniref:integrin alpha-8 isoform X2 n=1 Tax=Scomber japonicus TaxID=13676 RepID=UPI0023052F76|nr:integrin alpha-8 isoform X2 [Scomber japonicus]
MERTWDCVSSAGMFILGVLSVLWSAPSGVWSFNLYAEHPTVYRGPDGSYFGYSVDFYQATTDSNTISVLVGAPKANTSQPGIVEAGAVYYCPWPGQPDSCRQIPFDNSNNRMIKVNGTREPLEFKSHQWFGASVRTHKGKVVACAPLYHWRTVKMSGEKDPVGTCYVAVQNFSAYAEYSPCRTNDPDPEGQGFCQAGFSVDFTKEGTLVVGGPGSFYWQGQVMTAGIAEILNGYSLKAVLRRVPGEKHTVAAEDTHDDSYLGYSVAVGEFTGDSEQELIAGVPRGAQNFGYVAMINSTNLTFIQNFTGEQMASYFGYSVAVTDLNGDGTDDVLVGAPLYMEREMESKPREVGRVYLYLQMSPLTFSKPVALTGTHTFGRFGTAIAPLGDVNQDGYNDVAVGCPFGGEERGGRVLIFNGNRDVASQGLTLSQELRAAWTSSGSLPGYGFTLRGGQDLDNNQYPDLIVGAFGAGEVSVYRSRSVVSVEAAMILTPRILNPDDRQCHLPLTDTMVTCLKVDVCAAVSGVGIPSSVDLKAELQLDWLKGTRGGVKRVLFLDTQQPHHTGLLRLGHNRPRSCLSYVIYLREEDEFRDKLSPISLALNYSLASPSPHGHDLPPVLNHYSSTFLQEHAYILLDCGDDNICIPDLQLSASMDRSELVIGDDNLVMLTISAVNRGEGAYETELHTLIPPEADYIGLERKVESLSQLNCEYKMVNESRMVVCDLGNPMVAGTELSVGLRFSVQRLDDAGPKISFELQIHSSNKDNSDSNLVSLNLSIVAKAQLDLRGVSHPSQVVLPFPRWEPKEKPVKEDDVGPQVTHIYELHNSGPSSIGEAELQVGWPSRFRDENLLYAMEIQTDGPISCRTNTSLNPLGLQISSLQDTPELLGFLKNTSTPHRHKRAVNAAQSYSGKTLNCTNISCLRITCVVGRLDRGQSAVVKIRSRLWAHTFLQRRNDPYILNSTLSFMVTAMPYRIQPPTLPQHTTSMGTLVLWGTPDVSFAVPLWVIILAILLGLLVLAMLTLAMWKCGFFDRARPPADDDISDQEQLTSDQTGDA